MFYLYTYVYNYSLLYTYIYIYIAPAGPWTGGDRACGAGGKKIKYVLFYKQ